MDHSTARPGPHGGTAVGASIQGGDARLVGGEGGEGILVNVVPRLALASELSVKLPLRANSPPQLLLLPSPSISPPSLLCTPLLGRHVGTPRIRPSLRLLLVLPLQPGQVMRIVRVERKAVAVPPVAPVKAHLVVPSVLRRRRRRLLLPLLLPLVLTLRAPLLSAAARRRLPHRSLWRQWRGRQCQLPPSPRLLQPRQR